VHYSHNSGSYRRSVAPCITVLSWHTIFTKKVIYKFTFVWYSAKQGTMHSPTSHLTHLCTVPFLWPWEENRWQHRVDDFAGQCLLWQLSSRTTFFCARTWSSNQSAGGPQHLIPSRYQQTEFHSWLPPRVWFFSWPLFRLLQRPALFTLLCMTGHSCSTLMLLRYECFLHSDSKTDLKLQCDYCIKFQLFEGAQDVFSRLMAVCCMLLTTTPTDYTSTTRGTDFCGYLWFLSISFV